MAEGLRLSAAERIFRLLQFLMANECTRRDVFEYLGLYYNIDPVGVLDERAARNAGRMFERDIKFLREQGFEITTVRASGQLARYCLEKGAPHKMLSGMRELERRQSPVECKFWIDSDLAKALSQHWLTQVGEREVVTVDEEGCERRRTLVRATACDEGSVIRQILAYGDKAELVEPRRLRERMKETVRRMVSYYL